jgi:hypothetical protein
VGWWERVGWVEVGWRVRRQVQLIGRVVVRGWWWWSVGWGLVSVREQALVLLQLGRVRVRVQGLLLEVQGRVALGGVLVVWERHRLKSVWCWWSYFCELG